MSTTATDLTEEDAADLQFPKDFIYNTSILNPEYANAQNFDILSSSGSDISVQTCDVCHNHNSFCACYKCANCHRSLKVPFIECIECENINLCCQCFATGSELNSHKNDHNYRVFKHDFALFENSNWSAEEELTMLDVLYTYGYGNWELIAQKLKNRTEREIKEHYDRFYIDKPVSNFLPKVSETVVSVFVKPIVPYRFRLIGIEEPPRYAPHSLPHESVAGYNAARSEFDTDFDENAEQLLSKLTEIELDVYNPRFEILSELQCGVIRSYNHRLMERVRRKKIIRNHGLILARKTMSWLHRYDVTLTRNVTERLLCLMQFYSGIEFDYLMEGLHRAAELRIRISRLTEYRKLGISTIQAAQIYDKIKRDEEEHTRNLIAFESNPLFNWKSLIHPNKIMAIVPNRRGPFRPLDIVGLPGFEKLTQKEQELCSKVRLVPQSYIELKDTLVTENKKLGYLKLQIARKVLKIDVNKTRKLYDFLVEEGYIIKPTSIK